MKKLYLLLLCFVTFGQAQEILRVVYGSQTKTFSTSANEDPELKKAMEKAMNEVTDYELLIHEQQTQYRYVAKLDNDQDEEPGTIKVSFGFPEQMIYTDFNTGEVLKTKAIMNEKPLVRLRLDSLDWHITRESKDILGYKARKAHAQIGEEHITAWYTTDIAIKGGPEKFWGLPGLILELQQVISTEKGSFEKTFKVQKIENLEFNKANFKKPDASKAMSEEQFQELVQKQEDYYRSIENDGVDSSD